MKAAKYSLIVLMIAGATLSTYAQEETQRPTPEQREARRAAMLAEFDADGNGELSQDERQAAREARRASGEGRGRRVEGREGRGRGGISEERKAELLAEFDADGNGELSQDERQAARAARQGNGPGRGPRTKGPQGEDRGEMNEDRKAQILAKFDVDGDGELSKEERAAAREARQENGMARGERGGQRQGRGGMNTERKAEMLGKFDVDGDGELSSAERAAMKAYVQAKTAERKAAMVGKFDMDGDGELSSAEHAALDAYVQAKKAERKNPE